MKALAKSRSERGLWLEDVPEPETGINDVLIRVKRAAICGTDIHIWNWDAWSQKTIPVPMVVGHEFVGTVAAMGYELSTDLLRAAQLSNDLRESEERFRQVAETAGEFIWEVDATGLYTYASPSVEKILGFRPEELEYLRGLRFIKPDTVDFLDLFQFRRRFSDALSAVVSNRCHFHEYRVKDPAHQQ